MYFSDTWIGFLCENIIRQSVQLTKTKCPGCVDRLNSPILHLHEQQSLLDKLREHFEQIRGSILPTIAELYAHFQSKLPHSDDLEKDRECYIETGRKFLLMITCDALYYGRYVNEFVDTYIDEGFVVTKAKPVNKTPRVRKRKN